MCPTFPIISSSKNLFFTRLEPDFVFCVYAFALNGSILGEVLPHIIDELALGAIANRLGAFDKKDGTQTPPAQPVQPPQPATDPMLAQGQQVPPAAAAPAAPGATPPTAPVNPQEEMVTT